MYITLNGARVNIEISVQDLLELNARLMTAASTANKHNTYVPVSMGVPVELDGRNCPGVLNINVVKEYQP
jgi:hypothetical protein